jgi:xylose isomerase
MFKAFILGMDAFALGLVKAQALIDDGRVDKFVADRYAGFSEGIGAKIRSGEATLADLAAIAEEKGKPAPAESGNQEGLQSIVNQVLFG